MNGEPPGMTDDLLATARAWADADPHHGDRAEVLALVASGDVAGFAAAVRSLLADPEARRRMGEAGRLFAEARFSIDRLLSDLDVVYRELLPSRR